MKKLFLIIAVFFLFACDPECEECPDLTIEELITQLAAKGHVVDAQVKNNELFIDGDLASISGITSSFSGFGSTISCDGKWCTYDGINVSVIKSNLLVCDPFGWGVEYDWLCTISGTKGRALGKQPVADPVFTDVFHYVEQGSLEKPLDMTGIMYFSRKPEHYPNFIDSAANPAGFYGLTIAKWGTEWGPAVTDWCDISHPTFCI